MTSDVGKALLSAVDALEGLRLRYAVVGGLAVGAWGVNRSTKDADLYADLPDPVRAPLQRALRERGFDVPAMEGESGSGSSGRAPKVVCSSTSSAP